MNDWFRTMWCQVFFGPDDQYKPRKADVKALMDAIHAMKGDPLTKDFRVDASSGLHSYEASVFFADTCVATYFDCFDSTRADLTEAGEAISDDLIQLMQTIIDKYQSMEASAKAERAANARISVRIALDEARALLAAKRDD